MKELKKNNGVVGSDDKVINLFHGKRGKNLSLFRLSSS